MNRLNWYWYMCSLGPESLFIRNIFDGIKLKKKRIKGVVSWLPTSLRHRNFLVKVKISMNES